MEGITLDKIVTEIAKDGGDIPAHVLRNYLGFCTSELSRITVRYATAEVTYRKRYCEISEAGISSSLARIRSKATDEYEALVKAEQLKKYISEMIQSIKKMLQSKMDEYHDHGGL